MSTADLAIIGLVVINLVTIADRHYIATRMTDRFRVVSPPKQQQDKAAQVEPIATVRRTG